MQTQDATVSRFYLFPVLTSDDQPVQCKPHLTKLLVTTAGPNTTPTPVLAHPGTSQF